MHCIMTRHGVRRPHECGRRRVRARPGGKLACLVVAIRITHAECSCVSVASLAYDRLPTRAFRPNELFLIVVELRAQMRFYRDVN